MRMPYSSEYFMGRPQHPMWGVEARVIANLLGDSRKGTVLDVGCGSGALLEVIAPSRGLGVDIAEKAIMLAKAKHGQFEFVVVDGCKLPSEDGAFDAVVHMHLIEHLDSTELALREWRRVLRPGGRLVFCTPNAGFSHPEAFSDPDHKHIFHGPELAARVAAAGFYVEKTFTLGLWGWRRWPFLWRYRSLCERVRLPALPGLRWRGQTLLLSATKSS